MDPTQDGLSMIRQLPQEPKDIPCTLTIETEVGSSSPRLQKLEAVSRVLMAALPAVQHGLFAGSFVLCELGTGSPLAKSFEK